MNAPELRTKYGASAFDPGLRYQPLSFEAREDVFPRASAWADVIASSLRLSAPGEGRP